MRTLSLQRKSKLILSIGLIMLSALILASCQSSRGESTSPYKLYEAEKIELAEGTATYVLVPEGGHGAWCYEMVAGLLEAAGQKAYSVS